MDENAPLTAVVADARGRIFDLPGYLAVGQSGAEAAPLAAGETMAAPYGSELMLLPDRVPLLWSRAAGALEALAENPYRPGEPIFPVAVFNSPGVVATRVAAYRERPGARPLPLFSYGAVGWRRGAFRSAALVVDREPRQDLRRMPLAAVRAGVRAVRRALPGNRLARHLETCALVYGCPAGKNFFLGRYEAPLPTAVACNARCLGCLSLQKNSGIRSTQERIAFTPLPEEIAAVARLHIGRTRRAVVSFGQGCEGEPLSAARVIAPAIRLIREQTGRGTIHLNTNASRPAAVRRLCAAGLDSLRVSLNSARPACYRAYFRPRGYGFDDVRRSIDAALEAGKFVSINYLNLPGFTDAPAEAEALCRFLAAHPVHMIQWRNLNFDPRRYWAAMEAAAGGGGPPMGMAALLTEIRRRFPALKFGYFNPPKEKFGNRPPPG
jgi:pyruvate-formate lyase-activating enzyme